LNLLALDISLNTAGVARLVAVQAGQPVWDTETVKVPPRRVVTGLYKNGKAREKNVPRVGAARLAFWHDWLVEELSRGPELVAIEATAMGAVGHKLDQAELVGVLRLACFQRGVPFIEISVQHIKQFATGLHDCDKKRMTDTAVAFFGEGVCGEHEADAAWLGELARCAFLGGQETDAQGKVVANVVKAAKNAFGEGVRER
jgi:Holliday junction resolvasome RuvABC endonuclease subunit